MCTQCVKLFCNMRGNFGTLNLYCSVSKTFYYTSKQMIHKSARMFVSNFLVVQKHRLIDSLKLTMFTQETLRMMEFFWHKVILFLEACNHANNYDSIFCWNFTIAGGMVTMQVFSKWSVKLNLAEQYSLPYKFVSSATIDEGLLWEFWLTFKALFQMFFVFCVCAYFFGVSW